MNRIVHPLGPMGPKEPKTRFTKAETDYFAWLHKNAMCCLTGSPYFDLAHTGRKHMAMKSAPWTVLPLTRLLHEKEEKARHWFWGGVGFPDHLDWAARLHDHFTTDQDPNPLLLDMRERADVGFIQTIVTS